MEDTHLCLLSSTATLPSIPWIDGAKKVDVKTLPRTLEMLQPLSSVRLLLCPPLPIQVPRGVASMSSVNWGVIFGTLAQLPLGLGPLAWEALESWAGLSPKSFPKAPSSTDKLIFIRIPTDFNRNFNQWIHFRIQTCNNKPVKYLNCQCNYLLRVCVWLFSSLDNSHF